jgi:predicted nucleic acid-binding protein
MKKILVDTNVILDIFTQDPLWFSWSNQQLETLSSAGMPLVINPVVYAETSIGFPSTSELDRALNVFNFEYEELTKSALFSAGKAFLRYKASKGTKPNILPDFFIGAHADAVGYKLLTRDVGRYRTYFPGVSLINP